MLDARRFGLPDEEIAALKAHLAQPRHDGTFTGVWPENGAAVDAFLAGASQWRTSMDITTEGTMRTLYIGLDYAGVAAAHAARGMALEPAAWAGMQVMELAARAALNGEAG